MRDRMVSVLVRPTPLPLGIAVAGCLITVETLLGYPVKEHATTESAGILYILYLPGVLVVSMVWGFWLGLRPRC
jgi:hypothetical protein